MVLVALQGVKTWKYEQVIITLNFVLMWCVENFKFQCNSFDLLNENFYRIKHFRMKRIVCEQSADKILKVVSFPFRIERNVNFLFG